MNTACITSTRFKLSNLMWIRILNISLLMIGSICSLCAQKSHSGLASYYHDSLEGNKTASGEIFRQDSFTAAHKTLPFGTWVKLTGANGRQVVVRINDRLPANSSRMIDLTTAAARQMLMIDQGLKKVKLEIITGSEAWTWFIQNGFWRSFLNLNY